MKNILENEDFVSSCCGSKLCPREAIGGSPFICGHCGKRCQIAQLPDISVERLSKPTYCIACNRKAKGLTTKGGHTCGLFKKGYSDVSVERLGVEKECCEKCNDWPIHNPKDFAFNKGSCACPCHQPTQCKHEFWKDRNPNTCFNCGKIEQELFDEKYQERNTQPTAESKGWELKLFNRYCKIYLDYFKRAEIEGMDMVVGHLAIITRDAVLEREATIKAELVEKIKRLKVEKPNREEEENAYEIKKIWIEEAKQVLLAELKSICQ